MLCCSPKREKAVTGHQMKPGPEPRKMQGVQLARLANNTHSAWCGCGCVWGVTLSWPCLAINKGRQQTAKARRIVPVGIHGAQGRSRAMQSDVALSIGHLPRKHLIAIAMRAAQAIALDVQGQQVGLPPSVVEAQALAPAVPVAEAPSGQPPGAS